MSSQSFYSWITLTTRRAAWAPLTVFIFHLIATKFFNAYHYFPNLDIPMHFLGGLAIAYFFYHASIFASVFKLLPAFHRLNHIILVFSLTCSTTIFWEFSEFIADHLFNTYTQLGLEDTLFDMFLGIIGGLTWLVFSQTCFSSKIISFEEKINESQ